MSRRAVQRAIATLSFALIALPGSSSARQGQPADDGRGAQGVIGGLGRGRGGPAPGPPPRSAEGRVLPGGATPADKGVWLPGPLGGTPFA